MLICLVSKYLQKYIYKYQNNFSDAKDEEKGVTSTEKSGTVDNLIGDTLGSASGKDYFAKEVTQKSN